MGRKTPELSKIKLKEFLSAISEIETILKGDENGVSRNSKVLELKTKDNQHDLKINTKRILP